MSDPSKSLKGARSDTANRPRFDSGGDMFSTASSTPRNTRLVVSQTRLDGPRTHFCFGSCCRVSGFRNYFRQPDKQPDKTTHFTIPTWFSFFRVNNHFAFRKARRRKQLRGRFIGWPPVPAAHMIGHFHFLGFWFANHFCLPIVLIKLS